MRERPIGDLVTGLKQLGANVDCFLGTDCPPVRVVGAGGLPGGKVWFRRFSHFPSFIYFFHLIAVFLSQFDAQTS